MESTVTNDNAQTGEVSRFRMLWWDVISLEDDAIREGERFTRLARDRPSLPGRALTMEFRYNDYFGHWIWEVSLDGEGTIIPRQTVKYGKKYTYREHIGFAFIDFSKATRRVTPHTLGDSVELVCWPGARSPGWDDWVERQEILERAEPEVGAL